MPDGLMTVVWTLLGILLFLAVMFFLMYRTAQSNRERRKKAAKATARIVKVGHSSNTRYGKISVFLTIEVEPPAGSPYEVATEWWVNPADASKLEVGRTLAVKIDARDPKVIYSAEKGLSDMNN